MRTYIGTNDRGERAYMKWELKDGKFSSSGELWDEMGHDVVSCGQNIPELAEQFPDNEQAYMIATISKYYHLNNMIAGSPKQTELIKNVIKPAFDKLKEARAKAGSHNTKIFTELLKGIHRTRLGKSYPDDFYLRSLISMVKYNFDKSVWRGGVEKGWMSHNTSVYLGNKGVSTGKANYSSRYTFGVSGPTEGNSVDGNKAMTLTSAMKWLIYDELEDRFNGVRLKKRPSLNYYEYVKQELGKRGRLRDPDYIVDGEAYKYGTKWLKEDLPEEVVEEINSWVEVEMDEPTALQLLAEEHNMTCVKQGYDSEREQNTYKLFIGDTSFDFFAGKGVTNVDAEMILGCLLQEANHDNLEDFIEECEDLGYGASEAYKVAQQLMDNYEKLEECGIL